MLGYRKDYVWTLCRSAAAGAAFTVVFSAAAVSQDGRGPSDKAELAAFLDGVMNVALNVHDVAGATVSVVKDGKPFYSQGYGYADIQTGKTVDPDRTLFRIASVSKLFTWIAVMQLAEQGKLDLDTDINEYLTNVEIPATFPEPITLKHIMSHTPGFEDHVIGLFSEDASSIRPLDKVLRDELPKRVRPPGVLPSYSNHGTALAGLIVQEISGMPWEQYIEENILEPLAMRNTSPRQPLPENLADDISKGYAYENGRFAEKPFEFVPAGPAGSMSTTAGDMAHFMIALLNQGEYDGNRILRAETLERAYTHLYQPAPGAPGMLHGFIEMPKNGVYNFGHGGDTIWFHTVLILIPEHELGLFVSFNSKSGGDASRTFVEAFFDHYFPVEWTPPAEGNPALADNADRYTGTYGSIRTSYTTLVRMGRLMGMGELTVSSDPDGFLVVRGASKAPLRFLPDGESVFKEANGERSIYFSGDNNEPARHVQLSWIPVVAFERLDGVANPRLHEAAAALCLAVLFIALVAIPATAIYRRRKPQTENAGAGSPLALLAAWLMAAMFITFVAALAMNLGDPMLIVFGVPPLIGAILWLPLLALPLVATTLVCTVLVWKRGYWNRIGRIGYTAVAIAGVVFVWWLQYWNVLGHSYPA